MDDPTFGQEWGPLIAAACAAFAAVAAWVSALTARRNLRDSQRPHLVGQLVAPRGHPVTLHVRNIGGSSAKTVAFCVVLGHQVATGFVTEHGLLEPGETASVAMHFDINSDAKETESVLLCLDRENDIYTWDREGRLTRKSADAGRKPAPSAGTSTAFTSARLRTPTCIPLVGVLSRERGSAMWE